MDWVDARAADEQAKLLEANGLGALNEKVLGSPAGEVLDIVAEHNVAATIIRRGSSSLAYEPPSMKRPVDLVGVLSGRAYRIEVKRLALNEHDGLHATIMRTLNQALQHSHDDRVVISLQIADSFTPG